jgi:hypothetical protein
VQEDQARGPDREQRMAQVRTSLYFVIIITDILFTSTGSGQQCLVCPNLWEVVYLPFLPI